MIQLKQKAGLKGLKSNWINHSNWTCQTCWAPQNRTHLTNIHQPRSSYTVCTHVQKEFNRTKSEISLITPDIAFVWQTSPSAELEDIGHQSKVQTFMLKIKKDKNIHIIEAKQHDLKQHRRLNTDLLWAGHYQWIEACFKCAASRAQLLPMWCSLRPL